MEKLEMLEKTKHGKWKKWNNGTKMECWKT